LFFAVFPVPGFDGLSRRRICDDVLKWRIFFFEIVTGFPVSGCVVWTGGFSVTLNVPSPLISDLPVKTISSAMMSMTLCRNFLPVLCGSLSSFDIMSAIVFCVCPINEYFDRLYIKSFDRDRLEVCYE